MSRSGWAGVAGTVMIAFSFSACIAPDVEVVGALGVTVDAEARPIIVVEACDGAATGVELSFSREGLADDEENEFIGSWKSAVPVTGKSELALHEPSPPWQGEGLNLPVNRGFIATGAAEGDREVLSQVAFRGSDFAEMEPGMVYRNDPDPDITTLIAHTPSEFSAEVCGRG